MTILRTQRRRRFPSLLAGLLLALGSGGCSPGHMEAFPPPVRPGVDVHPADYRLHDAVAEYIQFRNLPVSPERMRPGVIITEWFPVDDLELQPTPLAICPGTTPSEGRDSLYRARYRFNILPRGGIRLFRVDAHWQRERDTVDPEAPRWVDCQSTGAWERDAEDRIILRAKLLSQRFRETG